MKFFFGIAMGALGMWAYRSGKLQELMGNAPEQVQQTWQPAVERFNQVANTDQVRQVASTVQSTVQDKMQQVHAPEIARPSAAEVAGRPSEPLPTESA